MGKTALFVMGPAGSGKSTFCQGMRIHAQTRKRTVHVCNLDPAAERFNYPPSIDIQDLIAVDDVSETLGLGPNGSLVYCMEYLLDNLEWFTEQLGDFAEDYLIFDCPGQIELYSHLDVIPRLVSTLDKMGYMVASIFCIDSHFVSSPAKFISGSLLCLSSMIALEIPHINVLTKMDLLKQNSSSQSKTLESFLECETTHLLYWLDKTTHSQYKTLNSAICALLEEYNLVYFNPLNLADVESIDYLFSQIDLATQWGEDEEPQLHETSTSSSK